MIAKSSVEKIDSDSDSNTESPEWKKGVNQIQQMYIAQQQRTDNNMDSDEEIGHIDQDQLEYLKKKAK